MNPIATPDDPRHGTTAGYRAHDRYKVPYCDDCRRARREYDAERHKRTGRRPGAPNIVEKAMREDVDWVVVHRIVNERRPCEANAAERLAVVRQWADLGRPLMHLTEVTGWTGVDRYLNAVRELEADQKWAEVVERDFNLATFRRAA